MSFFGRQMQCIQTILPIQHRQPAKLKALYKDSCKTDSHHAFLPDMYIKKYTTVDDNNAKFKSSGPTSRGHVECTDPATIILRWPPVVPAYCSISKNSISVLISSAAQIND